MKRIDRAIIKTLVYSDIFDWPLKGWEIQKWLIGYQASLANVESGLSRLVSQKKIRLIDGYYFLPNRKKIVEQRIKNRSVVRRYLKRAKWLLLPLKFIPWIKMVTISGSLAMENVDKNDDIDVMVVVAPGRLWLSRLIILGYLELMGRRRKRGEDRVEAAGKICANTLFTIDGLAMQNKNIYMAHEVLQAQIIWAKEGVYDLYLQQNLWAFEWLPNWRSADVSKILKSRFISPELNGLKVMDEVEKVARLWQLKKMGKLDGDERVSEVALYFQPVNYQEQVRSKYASRVKKYLGYTSPICRSD